MTTVVIKEYKDKDGDPAYMPPNGKVYRFLSRKYLSPELVKGLLDGHYCPCFFINAAFPNGLESHFVKDHIVEVDDE